MRPTTTIRAALAVAALTFSTLTVAPAGATPTWLLPSDPLSTAGKATTPAEVAMNARGDAVAVWTEAHGPSDVMTTAIRTRPAGGDWSATTYRGSAPASEPSVDINDAGQAVVVWLSDEAGGRVVRAARSTDTGWTTAAKASSVAGVTTDAPEVAIDAAGKAVAVWVRLSNAHNRVETADFVPGSGWTNHRFLSLTGDNDGSDPHVDVAADGRAVSVWTQQYADLSVKLLGRQRLASAADWSGTQQVSKTSSTDPTRADLSVSGDWSAAIWEDADSNTLYSTTLRADQGWATVRMVTDVATQSDDQARIAIDSQGRKFAVWTQDDGANQYVAWSDGALASEWGVPAPVTDQATTDGGRPALGVTPQGQAVVVWTDVAANEVFASVQRPGTTAWITTSDPLSAAAVASGDSAVAVDKAGDATAVWTQNGASEIRTATLDSSGPVARVTQPAAAALRDKSFLVRWTAKDLWSGVSTYDVRVRSARWNGTFGPWSPWVDDATGTSRNFAGTPGRTYCLSARATDSVDNTGQWSKSRCSATPIDDRTLQASARWTRAKGSAFYLRTITTTRARGADLTLGGVQAKRLSLLASTCKSCGTVKVSMGGTRLGTFKLTSNAARNKVLIPIKTFPQVRTGAVTITVTSDGKPVRIDGLVASRA